MCACNLVVAVTGSIAAYKACAVVSDLVQRGHRVRVVATPAALRFVGATTFEGLSGEPVRSDLFAEGAALDHINLTRWADGVLVCPGTAHTLNRLAAGLADDLLGALFLAHDRRKPFLIAPAMNPAMWAHPATVAAVELLQGYGVRFLPVDSGRTACGELGDGRLADPAEIVARTEAALARPARRLRVLVTSGGTAEPVDGARRLSNTSTGRTGAQIADRFTREGHDVVLLRARGSEVAGAPCEEELFETFADLDGAIGRILGSAVFDVVVHAAAVGDFGIERVDGAAGAGTTRPGKLDSDEGLTLVLRPQPKLVDRLRSRSRNPSVRIIAFKLTVGAAPAVQRCEIAALQRRAGPDFIVHNDLSWRGAAADAFPAEIHAAAGGAVLRCGSRAELAAALVNLTSPPSAD